MSNQFIGSNYSFFLRDLNSSPSVAFVLKSSYSRMRRPAIGEIEAPTLPAVFCDMFKIAASLIGSNQYVIDLPYVDQQTDYSDFGLINLDTYATPTFDILKQQKMLFASTALLTPSQTAWENINVPINFKPVVSSNSLYQNFNTIMHKCIIQPGILVQPYILINDPYELSLGNEVSSSNYRAFGPLLLKSATISGNTSGEVSITTSFQGSTCLIGEITPTTAIPILNESRESNLIDTRLLIGNEADAYFDDNDLFLESVFYNDYVAKTYTYQDLLDYKKKITQWTISINNTYTTTNTMPARTQNLNQNFISNDNCGTRSFLLNGRTVEGTFEFIYDRIQDFDNDYLADNNDTKKIIIFVAPNYYFPLTNVQFNIGQTTYNADKTVKADTKTVAKAEATTDTKVAAVTTVAKSGAAPAVKKVEAPKK